MPWPDPAIPRRPDVVLLFDASPASQAALEAALVRAGDRSRVRALYIEEHDWLCSARYAFAAEVSALSGALHKYDLPGLEQRLARRRQRVHRSLRTALEATRSDCLFEVVRGRGIEQVLALLASEEVLVVGRVGYTASVGRGLGSMALALARRFDGEVMLTAVQKPSGAGRVAVLIDTPEAVSTLLASAADRAHRRDSRLLVLLAPKGIDEPALLAWIADSPLSIDLVRLPSHAADSGSSLVWVLAAASVSELLLSRRGRLLGSDAASLLLARLPGTVSVLP